MDWLKGRLQAVFDHIIGGLALLGVVALVAATGGAIVVWGGTSVAIEWWEIILLIAILIAIVSCLVVLFRRGTLHQPTGKKGTAFRSSVAAGGPRGRFHARTWLGGLGGRTAIQRDAQPGNQRVPNPGLPEPDAGRAGHRQGIRDHRSPDAPCTREATAIDCRGRMTPLSVFFYILAYLLAVVDGALQDTALYPSGPGRIGFCRYIRKHPWIAAGAVCGVVGTILAA